MGHVRQVSTIALLCGISIACFDNGAAAQSITQVDNIPQDKICDLDAGRDPPGHMVNPRKFMWWVLSNFKIGSACIDGAISNETDNTDALDEKIEMLAKGAVGPECKQEDQAQVSRARSLLNDVLHRGGTSFALGTDQSLGARPVVDLFNSKLRIRCLNVPVKAVPEPVRLSDTTIGDWKLKLRGDQNSLPPDRKGSKEEYKKATSAKVSVTGDELKGKEKYDVKAAIGLDSDPADAKSERYIPYIKWERAFVSPAKKGDLDIDTIGVGMLTRLQFASVNSPLSSTLWVDPQFLTDSNAQSQILGVTLRWAPIFDVGNGRLFPGGEQALGALLYYDLHLLGIVRYGEVFDPGASTTLSSTNRYFYAGPEIGIDVGGRGLLDGIKLSMRYLYLYGAHGPFDALERFTSTLSYQLDTDGDVDISLTYDTGRDYEKLERREEWKAAIGYKF